MENLANDWLRCLANLCQSVLATPQGRLAAVGEWVLNEKRLTERAGFDAIPGQLAQSWPDLGARLRRQGSLQAAGCRSLT